MFIVNVLLTRLLKCSERLLVSCYYVLCGCWHVARVVKVVVSMLVCSSVLNGC